MSRVVVLTGSRPRAEMEAKGAVWPKREDRHCIAALLKSTGDELWTVAFAQAAEQICKGLTPFVCFDTLKLEHAVLESLQMELQSRGLQWLTWEGSDFAAVKL